MAFVVTVFEKTDGTIYRIVENNNFIIINIL